MSVKVIWPSAINLLTAAHEEMLTLRRIDVDINVTLPSLRRRALLVVRELAPLSMRTTDVELAAKLREEGPYER